MTATVQDEALAQLPTTDPDLLYSDVEDHLRASVRSLLADRGGPGVTGLRSVPVDGLGTVVLLHRVDRSGAQAQAVVAEADGSHWYLLTLAAQDGDRGPELQDLLAELVGAATPAG